MTADFHVKPNMSTATQKSITDHRELHCRGCKSSISRIKRGRFVKVVLFFLPLKRYVCYKCYRKTYRWGSR